MYFKLLDNQKIYKNNMQKYRENYEYAYTCIFMIIYFLF